MTDDGWVPFANRVESPNFGFPRGTHGQLTNPLAVVDHIMAGYFQGCRSWFRNPASWASSTFGISKDGIIDQYVSLYDCAWANGAVDNPDPIAAPVYTGYNPNVVTWSIEHEGFSGEPWTEAMYQADLKLKKYLWQRAPGLILLGHCHIDSVNKSNCPGPTWPRERLLADLKGEDVMTDADRAWVIQFSGGIKLVKGGAPTVYVVDHRGKRPFPGGPTEFLKVGFDWDNVIRLTDTVIGAIPNAQM
jgi:N-acetyl-anhydromuramyl-L-alanine amidase AmpD